MASSPSRSRAPRAARPASVISASPAGGGTPASEAPNASDASSKLRDSGKSSPFPRTPPPGTWLCPPSTSPRRRPRGRRPPARPCWIGCSSRGRRTRSAASAAPPLRPRPAWPPSPARSSSHSRGATPPAPSPSDPPPCSVSSPWIPPPRRPLSPQSVGNRSGRRAARPAPQSSRRAACRWLPPYSYPTARGPKRPRR